MRQVSQLAADAVVLAVVVGLLDHVAPDHLGGAVVGVGWVGDEIDFLEEPWCATLAWGCEGVEVWRGIGDWGEVSTFARGILVCAPSCLTT